MKKGGLILPNFAITVKGLHLSWIRRLLEKNKPSSDAWKAIPNAFIVKYGGLNFLLKCNYTTRKLDRSVSLFYLEMLGYFASVVFILASRLWNALPPIARESQDIASFMRSLKAHMA